jgi:glutaredoxin 3
MDQMEITVYARAHCTCAWRVKRLLSRKGYAFEVVDVAGYEMPQSRFVGTTGSKTAPHVFVDDRPVGGLSEIRALERSGDLDRLVRGEV